EVQIALRIDRSAIFIRREIDALLTEHQRLFQLGKKKHAPARRVQRSGQQTVITPCVCAGDGATGKAAQTVGLQPLAAEGRFQTAADCLIEADHRTVAAVAVIPFFVFCCWKSSSIIVATSAVQPVWWLAPTPAPVSPWKYSWKGT